ncbi:hypothetical protein QCA50_004282 [Cerrena zonata]|uniref:Uncharacterized protein n=1 Tax=Cerrena zonata TaxID=2478898 RepID=A0AAW0GT05_9APHY
MAPVRTQTRRSHREHNLAIHHDTHQLPQVEQDPNGELFLDPMMGTPLSLYVDKDVDERDRIVELITKNGGVVSPGYSGVVYILVDPHKESAWVVECVKLGELQTYQTNFAGCKVTGTEQVTPPTPPVPPPVPQPAPVPDVHMAPVMHEQMVQAVPPPPPMMQQPTHPHTLAQTSMTAPAAEQLVQHQQAAYSYTLYPHGTMHPSTAAPPQSWQTPNGIAPQQTHMTPAAHMMPRHPHEYQDDQQTAWAYHHQAAPAQPMVPNVPQEYEYRYREEPPNWVATASEYYHQQYDQTYAEPTFVQEAGPSTAPPPAAPAEEPPAPEPTRGRKRTRNQPQPAPPAASLVVNRRNAPARSPTPPTRVIKSTFGGNLFTADDIEYLKKYIDYCQEQGLVLSLREICERVAVKAPHHTFYSWRRYCNKHQIRLGGYAMDVNDNPEVPEADLNGGAGPIDPEALQQLPTPGVGPNTIATARQAVQADENRARSPTPPRALYRSTTGKGVAFTEEDVIFLVRFLEYRNRTQNGKVDMVAFWKDVAQKAPHHSRASWMKFYRRHKHELHHTEGDEPLPPPPEKKMRYSTTDDVLLAKFFYNKPEGTSDKIFQQFARDHPHHPWKGWQEHHRIHKAKIDHLITLLANGQTIDGDDEE